MKSKLLLACLLGSFLVPNVAQARRSAASKCKALKPVQSLPEEQATSINVLVKLRHPTGVSGSADVGIQSKTKNAVSLLEGNDLARAVYVHQLCVMKAEGTMSEVVYNQIMLDLYRNNFDQIATASSATPLQGTSVAVESTSSTSVSGEVSTPVGTVSATTKTEKTETSKPSEPAAPEPVVTAPDPKPAAPEPVVTAPEPVAVAAEPMVYTVSSECKISKYIEAKGALRGPTKTYVYYPFVYGDGKVPESDKEFKKERTSQANFFTAPKKLKQKYNIDFRQDLIDCGMVDAVAFYDALQLRTEKARKYLWISSTLFFINLQKASVQYAYMWEAMEAYGVETKVVGQDMTLPEFIRKANPLTFKMVELTED